MPSDETKRNILRIVRRTVGVTEVRDQLRVDPAVGRMQASTPANSDTELNKVVAQKIASRIPDAKVGEDWWFSGWRVEAADNDWNLVVWSTAGQVTLEGKVPRYSIISQALEAALQVQGVHSAYGPYGYDPDYFVYYYDFDPAGARARGFTGLHTMSGEVTKVDPRKGTVTLKTDEGTFDLHFPLSALQNVKPGERITVQLGLKQASESAVSPRTEREASSPSGSKQ